jgi:glycoprotein endo-alpha-1,2-mannosidase
LRCATAALCATAAALVLAAGATAHPTAPTGPASAGSVAIFFYPWYGTPARDGSWQHWNQGSRQPPGTIASGWYPARGAYSSSDPAVLRAQMSEIAAAGVDTVIVSWWGPGSPEDARLPLVVAAARAAGLGVAAHVEPFGGRDPLTLAPALQRLAAYGVHDFYVYDSVRSPDESWRELNAELEGVRLFANTGLPGKALAGGFAGLYTYDVLLFDGSSFPRMCASARRHGLVCAPSVGPGYDARRATGDRRVQPRLRGAIYDSMWRAAVRARADVVTITSYNEWHEGTQIEPARNGVPGYASYAGAWGAVGRAAERAYLDSTARWAARYRALVVRA